MTGCLKPLEIEKGRGRVRTGLGNSPRTQKSQTLPFGFSHKARKTRDHPHSFVVPNQVEARHTSVIPGLGMS